MLISETSNADGLKCGATSKLVIMHHQYSNMLLCCGLISCDVLEGHQNQQRIDCWRCSSKQNGHMSALMAWDDNSPLTTVASKSFLILNVVNW